MAMRQGCGCRSELKGSPLIPMTHQPNRRRAHDPAAAFGIVDAALRSSRSALGESGHAGVTRSPSLPERRMGQETAAAFAWAAGLGFVPAQIGRPALVDELAG